MPQQAGPEVAEFVRALALAWKNLAAYPPEHPTLVASLDLVHRRLDELRGPGGEVVLGIAADGVIYGEEKVESSHAHKFAHALYMRGVAVIRFDTATNARDLHTFLRLLGMGDAAGGGPPIWEALVAAGVLNIHLQPVDYSAVQVTDTLANPPQAPHKPKVGTLWEEIVRALVAGHELTPGTGQIPEVRSVNELTAMILRYVDGAGAEAEFDPKATFGVRLTSRVPVSLEPAEVLSERVSDTVAMYVAGSTGLKKQLVVQQVVQLLRALPEKIRAAVMRAVVRALAEDDSAAALLRDFTASVDRDEVLEALRYASSISKLSPHATQLLETLMPIARPPAHPFAAPAAVGDLVRLFEAEDIDRFNPPDHQALLDQAAMQIPQVSVGRQERLQELGDRVATVAEDAVSRQLARTLLELLSRRDPPRPIAAIFTRAELVFRTYLGGWQFGDAVELIERLQEIALTTENEEVRAAIHQWFGRLVSAETTQAVIDSLLEAKPEESTAIHHLIEVMGSEALRSLLVTLAEESNRSRRRRLLDFLISLGSIIVPEVRHFLADSRWYVVRNMILLLREVNDTSVLSEIRRLAQHSDLRVRLEAIKTLLALEPHVPRAVLERAINDPELAETVITLMGNYRIREAINPLLQILEQRDVLGAHKSLRMRAIKALGELADPSVLPRMERYFHDPFLPWPSKEERRTAFESLAAYPAEVRAPFVEVGLKSREEEIREICRKLKVG